MKKNIVLTLLLFCAASSGFCSTALLKFVFFFGCTVQLVGS